jgi:hypothetical protein
MSAGSSLKALFGQGECLVPFLSELGGAALGQQLVALAGAGESQYPDATTSSAASPNLIN